MLPAQREEPLSMFDRHPALQRRRACLALWGFTYMGWASSTTHLEDPEKSRG